MKFNIDIEINWIDEEENIDSMVKAEIINAVFNKIKTKEIEEKIQKKIDTVISNDITKSLEKNVTKTYKSFIEKEVSITDEYGDVVKECTMKELIKDKFNRFLIEKVDENGYPNKVGYKSQSRITWIIDERIKKHAESFTKNTINNLEEKLKTYFSEEMKKNISEVILKNTGLKAMIEDSTGKEILF